MLQSVNSARKPAYKRLSQYVSQSQSSQIRQLAQVEHWGESNLLRGLILIALCEELRDVGKPEQSVRWGPVFKRKKAFQRAHSRGVIISARLPAGLAKIIDTYAQGLDISKNEAAVNLIQLGTAAYCETQLRLSNSLSKSSVP